MLHCILLLYIELYYIVLYTLLIDYFIGVYWFIWFKFY